MSACMLASLPGGAFANSGSPPDEHTGAPGEDTCNLPFCHSDAVLDSGPGVFELIVPPSYVPDETYMIDVRLSQTGQMRWGFELTVLDAFGDRVGNLDKSDDDTQVSSSGGRQYIKHTLAGTAADQPDEHAWSFTWMAPSEDVGTVTFYAAGNAADNNNSPLRTGTAGDFIYTAQESVPVPEPAGLPGALGALVSIAALARAGRKDAAGRSPRGRSLPNGVTPRSS